MGCLLVPHLPQEQRSNIFTPIRALALRWWKRNTLRSFLKWYQHEHGAYHSVNSFNVVGILRDHGARVDWEAGRDCIKRHALATWWDWDLRSRPLNWNWSTDYQPMKRDGIIPWFLSPPPTVTTPQPVEKNGEIRGKVKEKLRKVQEKGKDI